MNSIGFNFTLKQILILDLEIFKSVKTCCFVLSKKIERKTYIFITGHFYNDLSYDEDLGIQ